MHSPAFDLLWQMAMGRDRCTRGANRSWNGLVKRLAPSRYDSCSSVTGRRWYIRRPGSGGGSCIRLGGPPYAAFEVEPDGPLVPRTPISD